MALFAKFEIQTVAKVAKVEKVAATEKPPSQVSQLSQAEPPEKSTTLSNHRPCYCCKGTDYWLGGTEKYPHWICRKCHPPAPGAEKTAEL
jgi:hypothetical protein